MTFSRHQTVIGSRPGSSVPEKGVPPPPAPTAPLAVFPIENAASSTARRRTARETRWSTAPKSRRLRQRESIADTVSTIAHADRSARLNAAAARLHRDESAFVTVIWSATSGHFHDLVAAVAVRGRGAAKLRLSVAVRAIWPVSAACFHSGHHASANLAVPVCASSGVAPEACDVARQPEAGPHPALARPGRERGRLAGRTTWMKEQ